jgi:hypothetical protein
MKFPIVAFSVLFLSASSFTLEKRQASGGAGPFGTWARAGDTCASTGGGFMNPGFVRPVAGGFGGFTRPCTRWF